MNVESNRLGLRVATGTVIGAVLALTLAAVPASAAPTSLVDGDALGSITVHKFERPDSATELSNNGTEITVPDSLTPLPGVTFSVQPVQDVDLATNAGWATAYSLSDGFDPGDIDGELGDAGLSLGAATTLVTDGDGTANFAGLPVGLYLVSETAAPSGVVKSVPFLITVPLTDPANGNAWLYDVHVYPKNAVVGATKTVTDAAAVVLGDEISWTIESDIPTLDTIDGYRVSDTLGAALSYDDADGNAATSVTLSNGAALAASDYEVAYDAATRTVSVTFTDSGLLVLAENPTASVVTTISTTANSAGEIENSALIYPDLASFDIVAGQPGGPLETSSAITKWGGLTLAKVDQDQEALTGAEFSIFSTEADALAGTNALSLDGETVFPVDANGELTLTGLRYSDWADGASVARGEAGFVEYFVVEITAPEGYELLAEPVPVLVNADTTTVGIDHTITNVESNAGFTLPLTGGTGAVLLYVAGALLLLGAGLLFVRLRRARN